MVELVIAICLPTVLIPILLFFVVNTVRNSHKTDVLFYTDNIFFLSILTGFLGLIVGLIHEKFIPASYTDLFPHDAYTVRGWPVAWLGQPSLTGWLFVPLCIVINIIFVASFTAAALSIVRLIQRHVQNSFGKMNLDPLLVSVFALFPYWGTFIPWVQLSADYLDSFINT